MAKTLKFFLIGLAIGASALLVAAAKAEVAVTTDSAATEQILEQSAALAGEPQELQSVKVEEPAYVPTNFGLWWRDVREKISLALTIDQVKKAAKSLKFAEERVRLADLIAANGDDQKFQEKAARALDKAGEYVKSVEANQADLLNNAPDKVKTLLSDLAAHYANKEQVLEKLEDKVPAEKLESFQASRQELEAGMKNVLNSLTANQNLPEAVKNKITQIKNEVETKLQARQELRLGQKELLEKIKTGNTEAKIELENLRQEKLETTAAAREDYQEKIKNVINQVKSGQTDAVEKLKALNRERAEDLKQLKDNFLEKTQAVKTRLETIKIQGKEDLKQNRQNTIQQLKEIKSGNKINQLKEVSPAPAATE